MALEITEKARLEAEKTAFTPNLVLLIEGVPYKFGAQIVKKVPRFGEDGIYYGMPGLFYGQNIPAEGQRDYISISGTSDTIQQQLDLDQGSGSSTQTLTVRLLDVLGEVTAMITPGVIVPDIMYRNAELWLGVNPDLTSFPEDYIPIFNGKIQQVNPAAGAIDLVIAHPEDIKRSDIFLKAETFLTAELDFNSKLIQDIFYQARPDVVNTVSVEYISGATGDNATVNVSGNLIIVTIDPGATRARTIKKKIENHEDANQLVVVDIEGDPEAIQIVQAQTDLESDTEIEVDDVTFFLEEYPPILQTYAKIGNEIIRYTGIDTVNKKLTGCTRASLNTFGFVHEDGDEVSSFYKLGDGTFENGNAIDLTLWTLLSGAPSPFSSGNKVKKFVQLSVTDDIPNAVFFKGDVKKLFGIVVGDTMSVTGATNGANNFTDKIITEIVVEDNESYLIIDGVSLVSEPETTAVASFKSKYNILPTGLGLIPTQVDVEQFEFVKGLYTGSIAQYEYYLKDTIKAQDLMNDFFTPSALLSVPRKGRISVAMTAPPLYAVDTKVLDITTVKNPGGLKLQRSVTNNFFNAVQVKYNEDSLEDTFLSGKIVLSATSTTRINAPTKAMKIEAKGLRPGAETESLITRNADRYLQRFQFGAESIPVEVPFHVGWTVEIADPIVFGDVNFKLPDITRGDTQFAPRIFQVVNKDMNWKTGRIRLMIADTTFNANLRYGVWSPTSNIVSGSTTTEIIIVDSFGTAFPKKEKDKWLNYYGKDIVVHNEDWSVAYNTTIVGFDNVNPYKMIVDQALPAAPGSSGWQVDIARYDDISELDQFLKSAHLFWDPQLTVVSGISPTQFTVSPADAAKLFVDGNNKSIIRVHNTDYSIDSGSTPKIVSDVTGVTVTVEDLGFTPAAGQKIEFVGFVSNFGKPYAWV